jgi:hypothetical protein
VAQQLLPIFRLNRLTTHVPASLHSLFSKEGKQVTCARPTLLTTCRLCPQIYLNCLPSHPISPGLTGCRPKSRLNLEESESSSEDGKGRGPKKKNLTFCKLHLGTSNFRLIGKLTASLQLQEFSQRNQPPVDSFTFAARLFLLCSNRSVAASLPRRQLSV